MKKIVVMSSNKNLGNKIKKALEDKLKVSDSKTKTEDQIEVVTFAKDEK